MSNSFFRFKQFTIHHDRCAMKVGTDGVLLGAWANGEECNSILDIGAGSGLVSLMLAQRFRQAKIESIEIDAEASSQANENYKESSFPNLDECVNISLQDFAHGCDRKYDLIVSNPPFFSRSLKSPDHQRSVARHTDSLLIEEFVSLSASLLNDRGKIAFVFPYSEKGDLMEIAASNKLYISKMTNVYPTPSSEPKRLLMELSNIDQLTIETDLVVETARHVYSAEFVAIVKDFYLKM